MDNPAIRIENLGKRYRIGERNRQRSLRDVLARIASRDRHSPASEHQHIWALRGVSFDIPHGQVTGIIGRNGAGKSTLLKILSRITRPTEGRAEVWGKVGSLLEVGTGFHPELTGRENVYLNGSILGMNKQEMDRKFDEIVAFAETEAFIDTPVKYYSSGMQVRLAFAVAAHLEPEILIIDEVLAVGDIAFQRRCLGKMEEVAGQGRTVLFVSHNLHAVAGLCDSVVWIDGGRVRSIGPAKEQIAAYSSSVFPASLDRTEQSDTSQLAIRDVRLINDAGEERESFDVFEGATIVFDVAQHALEKKVRFVIRVRSMEDDSVVLATTSWDSSGIDHPLGSQNFTVECLIPPNFLNAAAYSVSVGADEPNGPAHAQLEDVRRFVVVSTESFGDGLYGARDGVLSPYREWRISSTRPQQSAP
jgi:lipopolysaccharide transport system ATP-binding protein